MNARHAPDLAIPVTHVDHILGRTDAPVTLVEYGDFECPACRLAFPAVKLLLQRCGSEICFAYRHYPLHELHPHALPAAEAAECAGSQERFWEMHDLMFENQARLKRSHLQKYARRLNLDIARFVAELDTHAHAGRVRADLDSGIRSRVRSTPGFFINGRIVDVSFGMRALFEAAEDVLQRGRVVEDM
jgi:protein-disulfide isomerase